MGCREKFSSRTEFHPPPHILPTSVLYPPSSRDHPLALFLRCPQGYMLMHYVVMIVQKARADPGPAERETFWRNQMRV